MHYPQKYWSHKKWVWSGNTTITHCRATMASWGRATLQGIYKFLLLAFASHLNTGLRSAVGNVSGYRCESDCKFRGREFDPGPVPYFLGDWSWNNFYGHSPPFRWIIQEGLLPVTSERMCTKYWLTACSSLPRIKVWIGELTVLPWP